MAKTSETLDKAQQLAMEVRIRAGMMVSDYRRSNIMRLRRAHRYAENLARRDGINRQAETARSLRVEQVED